jgi:hypothetical protein
MNKTIYLYGKNLFKQAYPTVLIVFFILQALSIFGFIQQGTISFAIFGLSLGIGGIFISTFPDRDLKISSWWIAAAVPLAILFRTIPYFDTTVPYGYDAGLYKYAFEYPFDEGQLKKHLPSCFSVSYEHHYKIDRRQLCFNPIICFLLSINLRSNLLCDSQTL